MLFQVTKTTENRRPRSSSHPLRSLCLALAIALGAPTVASAATEPSVTVRFGDLDLSRTDDAQKLLIRLERAADIVCEGAIYRQYMTTTRAFRKCYRTVLATAVARLDGPLVRSHYVQRRDTRG